MFCQNPIPAYISIYLLEQKPFATFTWFIATQKHTQKKFRLLRTYIYVCKCVGERLISVDLLIFFIENFQLIERTSFQSKNKFWGFQLLYIDNIQKYQILAVLHRENENFCRFISQDSLLTVCSRLGKECLITLSVASSYFVFRFVWAPSHTRISGNFKANELLEMAFLP